MKLESLSIFLSSLILSMVAYMFYTSNRVVSTYAPLIDASRELKSDVSQAHLWLQSVISGASNNNVMQVRARLDIADEYANLMAAGGQRNGLTATDALLVRNEIQQIGNNLSKLRDMTEQLYKTQIGARVGFNQEFDILFKLLIKNANSIEKILQYQVQVDLANFRKNGIVLLVAAILLAFITVANLLKNRQRNTIQIARINSANQLIEEKDSQRQTMAHYDFLTGLPNRTLLSDLLKTAIVKAQRNQQWLVLFFIDLDHFKIVNDSYGHQVGDELLKQVGERLTHVVGAEDCVARISGDEFTLLLEPIDSQQRALAYAHTVVKKIHERLAESFYIKGTEVFISASTGIALYPKDGESSACILKNADRSMCDVKQMGKDNYRFFSPELEHSNHHKLRLAGDLRKAIQLDELELYYQPQWDFKTGRLFGFEALVRWNHPKEGLLFPDEFISVAESCGLIYQLDMWVLDNACKQLRQWKNEGGFSRQVSINMSAVQFSSPNLVEKIVSVLAHYGIAPRELEIEIVESVLMQDSEHTLSALIALKELGINIAIDDFGTGYSSMAYLSKFPIDVLKIDRTFVAEIGSSIAAKVIVESIIKMATKLGLTIVAEGIETEEQSQFLALHGCTFAQGYFYNKPMPVNDVSALLRAA